jgi:DNA polymerase IV
MKSDGGEVQSVSADLEGNVSRDSTFESMSDLQAERTPLNEHPAEITMGDTRRPTFRIFRRKRQARPILALFTKQLPDKGLPAQLDPNLQTSILRNTEERPKMKKSVLFVDPPAFCTTVEGLVAPALRRRPIVIAPPGADRATILALSVEARKAGISPGMLLAKARKVCPDLVILPPNPRLYARASRALHDVLRRYAPIIEPRGYGHAFLDLSGTAGLFGPAVDVAERIRREANQEIRLPLTVGVASNKLVSQTAVRADRRAGGQADRALMEVSPGDEASFLAPHEVDVLPDLSEPVREKLNDYQLDLIGEVAALTEQQACSVFGRSGRELVTRARGIDPRPVLSPELKSEFRIGHALASDTNDLGVLHTLLRRMSERLGRRLRARHLAARRLVIELAYTDYKVGRHSLALQPALLDVELWDAARRAFTLANIRPVALRAVTLTADRIIEEEAQLDLFWSNSLLKEKDRGKQAVAVLRKARQNAEGSLQAAMDRITARWGSKVLIRGINFHQAFST